MTNMTRRIVRNGEIELAVFEGGNPEGPTVVLVHGWPDTHHLWNRVVDALAAEFRLVAYDTRGMGESTDPGAVEAFALPHLAKDFFAVVDAVSPDAPVHVVAHDWGSIGVWEAVCEPGAEERVSSFTSISGPNLDHLAAWSRRTLTHPTAPGLGRLVQQTLSFSYVGFFVSPAGPPVLRRLASVERWARLLQRTDRVLPRPDDLAPTLPEDMVSGLRYYRANVGSSLSGPRERRTTVPVLVLKPTRDPAVRAASYADTERWVEHVERRELPYGHWVVLSHPEVVADEAARFIRSQEPGPTPAT
jgi:pimeloyl-ACP methyl ester carboxylesterase